MEAHDLEVSQDEDGKTVVKLDGKEMCATEAHLHRIASDATTVTLELYVKSVKWNESHPIK